MYSFKSEDSFVLSDTQQRVFTMSNQMPTDLWSSLQLMGLEVLIDGDTYSVDRVMSWEDQPTPNTPYRGPIGLAVNKIGDSND